MILLAKLGWTVVVETTTPASEIVASEICTFTEVISSVEITTSAMVSTGIEVTSITEPPTTTTRGISRYTSANGYVSLVV